MKKKYFLMCLLMGASTYTLAQTFPSTEAFSDGIHHWNLDHSERNYKRYPAEQYVKIADNLVAYQNEDGGWPKNIDWMAELPADSVVNSLSEHYRQSTLDNRNTYSQIEYLAQVYTLTKKPVYRKAVLDGLEYLLKTQKKNGGWRGWDVDAITFNDEVTTGVLRLFLHINEGDLNFTWLDDTMCKRIYQAFNRGIDMILRTQYVQNGVKTVWGQQHDNQTLLPTGARTFELASLTAGESCDVVRLLMEIPHPSDEVIEAVKSAMAWFDKVAITGIRVEKVSIPADQIVNHEYPYDRWWLKTRRPLVSGLVFMRWQTILRLCAIGMALRSISCRM